MAKFINWTQHSVNIIREGETILSVAPSGKELRVSQTYTSDGEISGVPVTKVASGDLDTIPAPEEGVIHIVSQLAAQHPALAGRADVVFPLKPVRDEKGTIIGAEEFGCI